MPQLHKQHMAAAWEANTTVKCGLHREIRMNSDRGACVGVCRGVHMAQDQEAANKGTTTGLGLIHS